MDLKTYKFPKLTGLDVAFSIIKTDPELLKEAKARGFCDGNTPYNDLFSTLFFTGGKLNWKKDLPADFKQDAGTYLKALMGSFEPSHEDKEAISAMLLSELVDI